MIPKAGDRIEMVHMPKDPDPIPSGTQGTVENVEYLKIWDQHQVSVKWDNGRTLSVIIPPDKIKILENQP